MDKEYIINRHRQLTGLGWERRFVAEEPKITEMKEYYETLGFEVMVEPVAIDDKAECDSCLSASGFEETYKTIYTRGHGKPSHETEELF
jgi:hypothetical protein